MLVPERQTYAFGGPRHSFLGVRELFVCANVRLNGAGIYLAWKNFCIYFLCIFFLMSRCSNSKERAQYYCRLEIGLLRADALQDSLHSSVKALNFGPEMALSWHRDLTLPVLLCPLFQLTFGIPYISSGAPCLKYSLLIVEGSCSLITRIAMMKSPLLIF